MGAETRLTPLARRAATFNLFVAFAFTVMADPVSSVAYALEAALHALDGDLSSLVPTMALVLGTIGLVATAYHDLIGRYPDGGGGAKGIAAAFGEAWAFVPLGALLVDFTLTIAVSCAAGASAAIAYLPGLADARSPLALGLVALVAGGVLLGHRARVVFATATLAFLGTSVVVLVAGAGVAPAAHAPALAGDVAVLPMILAMPLGMALATGVEAPADAIAQLGELDSRGRRRFGRLTLWLMIAIVTLLTFGLAALAVRFGLGAPPADSTLLAGVAQRATGGGALFAAFQGASALLLLAAAASSYLAGSGLLKALALHVDGEDGLVPRRLGVVNASFVPPAGVGLLMAVAGLLVVLSGGHEQELVRFYAVAVFVSFLAALVACDVLTWRERRFGRLALNLAATAAVALVLALNLGRLDPLISLAAAGGISLYLWAAWVRHGRPAGIAEIRP